MANTINVTSDTVVKLIVRRGSNTDRQSVVLASGELGYALDIKRLFIGDGITLGGNLIGNQNFGIVQGIQNYVGIAQQGDIVFQNIQSTGAADNVLYAFNNNQWQPISPVYGSAFDYSSGSLNLNPTYFNLDTNNYILTVKNSVSTQTISANSTTIFNTPVVGTDGTNKDYVDSQVAAAESINQAYTRSYVGSNYVPLSGNATMFGTLSSTSNISVSSAPIAGPDLTNKTYVDVAVANARAYTSNFLPLSGGTLTGALSSVVTTSTPAVTIQQNSNGQALAIQNAFYVNNLGNVGISTLPVIGAQLTVLGTISATNATIVNSTANTLNVVANASIGGNATIYGTVSAVGDVIAYCTSDKRLKNNVVPITSALTKIDSINGVEYDWNSELQTTYSGHDVGVIAQEIEQVLPEAVVTRDNGYKAVNYDKVIPLLLQAIKELKAEIQALKNN
jgi:hypothetical protein